MREMPNTDQVASHRQMLRTATADLHARVDAGLTGAFDTDLNAYRAFLAALACAVPPLEQAIEQGGIQRLLPDWPSRRRGSLLKQDLVALEVPPAREVTVPEAAGDAFVFGMAYVLEGSRLGGGVLLKRVLANPDPRAREATRYLSHGRDARLWPDFLSRLESSSAVRAAPDDAVAGARVAFGLFVASSDD
jgi:heme oxygenase